MVRNVVAYPKNSGVLLAVTDNQEIVDMITAKFSETHLIQVYLSGIPDVDNEPKKMTVAAPVMESISTSSKHDDLPATSLDEAPENVSTTDETKLIEPPKRKGRKPGSKNKVAAPTEPPVTTVVTTTEIIPDPPTPPASTPLGEESGQSQLESTVQSLDPNLEEVL